MPSDGLPEDIASHSMNGLAIFTIAASVSQPPPHSNALQ